jgi:hypothetical protein
MEQSPLAGVNRVGFPRVLAGRWINPTLAGAER